MIVLTPNNPDGTAATIDISENNKLYVRAKAGNLGTQLRLDVKDAAGYATTLAGLTKTLVSDYTIFEFDFNGNLSDGGYGGTSCEVGTGPCPVDPTNITEFNFYVNPGQGSFSGTVVMDFVAVGSAPGVGPASEIWQNHFDDESALGYMNSAGPGLTNSIANSNWIINGDGTGDLFAPVSLLFYNPTTTDTIDVPVNQGDDKVYLRMRTSTPNTTVRLDLQDINNMATTGASITKTITDEWTTYEYNFSGSYTDLGFGGTGCSSDQAPCIVDSERIRNMIIFINPGTGAFVGDIEIDYISVGTSLEEGANDEGELVYGDHFSGGDGFVSTTTFGLGVDESVLKITGDGSATPFSSIAYTTHNMDSGSTESVDVTGNNKLYIRAKSDAANTLLRVDLIDTAGYTTTLASITKLLESDYSILEFDYSGQYIDAGYGGTACESDVAPCPVDPTAIANVLLYPNPADGGFTGCLEVDFISFGAPMGEDVTQYIDEFDNDNRDNWSDASGFTVEETEGELLITGDGTSGAFTAFNYTAHNTDDFTPVIFDMTSNNKLYVKAKSTVAGTPLRIDLVDQEGFASTEPATIVNLSEEYEILELDYAGTYMDGGYGGTPCTMGPCDVDGTTVQSMLFYIDPNNGGFAGTVTIDWISSIAPLEEAENQGELGVDDYADSMDDNSLDFISGTSGLTTVSEEGLLKIIGDGTSGEFSPVVYKTHEGPDSLIVNAESNNNKVFIRARSTVDGLPFRLDLQDNQGFLTSLAGLTQGLSTEFEIYEFDFSGSYSDGGFGGTPCTSGPCTVDAQRIEQLFFYLNPGIGMFSGEVHIDWISFGEPFESVNVIDLKSLNSASIYPNPTSDVVFIEFDTEISGSANILISDVSGRTVQQLSLGQLNLGTNLVELDLANFHAGFYFVQLHLGNKLVFVDKLIIKE